MEIEIFKFPTLKNDGVGVVENTYCELYNRYRSGESLGPEILDWMDAANNWLMTAESNRYE